MKLKINDYTKIIFFLSALPFLISGLILTIMTGEVYAMFLVSKGIILLGFGFSRNGVQKKLDSIDERLKKLENKKGKR